MSGPSDLQTELERIVKRVHAAGSELQVVRGRLRTVTPRRSAREALGMLLHNDVRVFARRLVQWMNPARCVTCGQIEVPSHGGASTNCGR